MSVSLEQFVEYKDIYEYSKDYLDFHRALYEIDLMGKYIEAHDYIQEMKNLSFGQIKSLMVESNLYYQAPALEEAYTEKVGSILGKVAEFFIWIGNAIVNLFRRVVGFFTGSNKQAQVNQERIEMAKTVLTGMGIVGAGGVAAWAAHKAYKGAGRMGGKAEDLLDGGNEVLGQTGELVSTVRGSFLEILAPLKNFLGVGMRWPVKLSKDSGTITTLDQTLEEVLKLEQETRAQLQTVEALSSVSYTVMAPSSIKRLNEINEVIGKALMINPETVAGAASNVGRREAAVEVAFKAFERHFNSPQGYLNKFVSIKKNIEDIHNLREPFEVSEASLTKALGEAELLNDVMSIMASYLDVGAESKNDPAVKKFVRFFKPSAFRDPEQAMTRDAMIDDANDRIKDSTRVKGGLPIVSSRSKFLRHYPAFISALHSLAQALQVIVADMIKGIGEHMKLRKQAQEAQSKLIDSTERFANDLKQQAA